ncbi:MAG TPA: hypothetical protein P5098_00350 [Candidatus Dojkabacteria bacterium]|nr:hypothetical protein [Candidatus Dojkabacteria bacterium]
MDMETEMIMDKWKEQGDVQLTDGQCSAINQAAMQRLIGILEEYENTVSDAQRQALMAIQEKFTAIASGRAEGRFAFPLPPGAGKTCSVISWAATLNKLGHDHIALIVCASKVEALCEIKRALMKHDVPEGKIGLIHSYKYNRSKVDECRKVKSQLPQDHASEPSDDDNGLDKQFLLITHQRVKSAKDIAKFNSYRGRERNIVIWDESLIASESFGIRDDFIESAIGGLRPLRYGKTPDRDEALEYCSESLGIIKAEINRQQQESIKGNYKTFKLPLLSGSDIERYKAALVSCDKDVDVTPLTVLLDISQENLRVLTDIEQGSGLVTYNTVVPPEIKNIVILDASHIIRDLVNLDNSIKTADVETKIVSYSNVVMKQLHAYSGRNTVTNDLKKKGNGKGLYIKEIMEVVKNIPKDEGILIFLFKTKHKVNFKAKLLSAMEDAGIDTEATIETKDGLKSRFAFNTWGNETATSQFSYCKNIIFYGVLHLPLLGIGASIIGQLGDLLASVSGSQIREVQRSEIGHSLYQGMCRGCCRIIDGSATKPMNVWLIHNGEVKSLIQKVMPDINWLEWTPKFIPIKETKGGALVKRIQAYLQEIQETPCEPVSTVTQISICQLKKALKYMGNPNTFTNALDKAIAESCWLKSGRSLVCLFPSSNLEQTSITRLKVA